MGPRTRLLVIMVITFAALGGALIHAGWRASVWHERGWAGVYYFSGPGAAHQARLMGMREYQVLMTVSGSPADGVLRYRDEVLTINGIRRDDLPRLEALDRSLHRGSLAVYRVRRGDRVVDVPLRFESPLRSPYVIIRHVLAVLVALIFVVIAVVIMARAPGDMRAFVFYMLALLSAIALIGNAATLYEQSNARGLTTSVAASLANIYGVTLISMMYAPLILHLGLIFPRRRPIVERHPHVIRWVYAVALLTGLTLVFAVVLIVTVGMGRNPETDARLAGILKPVIQALIAFGFFVLLHVLWAARREGIRRAIATRPFRVSIAAIGVLLGLSRAAGMFVSDHAGGVLGAVAMGLPVLILSTFPVLACIALFRSHRAANVEEKRQVAWPLWGLLIAVGTRILVFVVSFVVMAWLTINRQDMIAWRGFFETLQAIPTLITVVIPISFAVAILKYRLMNIDVIIRKTVVYAILSGAIIVVYFGIVGGLGSFLVYAFGLENQTTMIIGSTLVVALLFVPVRNKLQTLVDRNLFRHRYDYPQALGVITTESRTADDMPTFLGSAAEKLQQALQNRAVVIFLERQDEFVAAAKLGVSDTILGQLRVPRDITTLLDRPFDPRRRTLSDEAARALGRVEAALVVPVGNRGFIAFAPKLSGREFDVEDVDFVRAAADQIDAGIDRIRMQAEEEDFAQARTIQQSLLPRAMPRVSRLDVSGMWQPARTMGGDYYDLLPLSDTQLAFCIGDVAGKGMPAALLMSGLQAAVRASASNSPRDLCERVRRVVVSTLTGGRFVTFFYATVDTASMRLRWCNAGHNAPILARADGTIVRLSEGGPAFSRLFAGAAYEEREMAVGPGDRIVLFTDGVSEAADEASELFGEARIEEMVRSAPDLPASKLQETIVHAATAFSGGDLEDDVTLVVVRITD